MTPEDYRAEFRHIYETRLAILNAPAQPTADQHNLAHAEALEHEKALKREMSGEAIQPLLKLRDML